MLRFVALVAPYIFIAGLVGLVSLGVDALLISSPNTTTGDHWDRAAECTPVSLFFLATMLVALSVFMSWRIGVNEFSMHHFYKSRLVRCYLGRYAAYARRVRFRLIPGVW